MNIGYMLFRTGEAIDLAEQVALIQDLELDELAFHSNPGVPLSWGGFDATNATPADVAALDQLLNGYVRDIHAPFGTCRKLDSPVTEEREAALAELSFTIEAAAALHAETVTIHPGSWCILAKSEPPTEERLSAFRESLRWLDHVAGRLGVTIGMESTSHFALPRAMGLDHVGLTLDLGHMMFGRADAEAGNNAIVDTISRHGNSIVHVHTHDYVPSQIGREDHWPVGVGVVDFPRILDALASAGYEGSVCLEIAFAREIRPGVAISVDMLAHSVAALRRFRQLTGTQVTGGNNDLPT